jgi:hypothetical protein
MPDGGPKTKKGNDRLVLLFVGREELGEGAEVLGEEVSVVLGTLLEDRVAYQGAVEAHRRQAGVGRELEGALQEVPEVEHVGFDEYENVNGSSDTRRLQCWQRTIERFVVVFS